MFEKWKNIYNYTDKLISELINEWAVELVIVNKFPSYVINAGRSLAPLICEIFLKPKI